MSEIEKPVKCGGVHVYRVALVRESGIGEPPSTPVRKSSEAAKILRPLFEKLDREQFVVLLLDAQHKPIGANIVSIGSLTASLVHARETFKPAILSNSADHRRPQSPEWFGRTERRGHRAQSSAP
jgi:DNA repair protein RadC